MPAARGGEGPARSAARSRVRRAPERRAAAPAAREEPEKKPRRARICSPGSSSRSRRRSSRSSSRPRRAAVRRCSSSLLGVHLHARAVRAAGALAAGRGRRVRGARRRWCIVARYGSQRGVLEVAVAAVPVVFLGVIARGRRAPRRSSIAGTLLGIYWIGFAFAHAELLRELPHGGGILSTCWSARSSATPPLISAGGCSGDGRWRRRCRRTRRSRACSAGCFSRSWPCSSPASTRPGSRRATRCLLGVAVAVLGPLGDLFESLVKRDAGVEGPGSLFGAHGGALDRLDAVMFTVVAGYYIWRRCRSTRPHEPPTIGAVPRRLVILGSTGSIGVPGPRRRRRARRRARGRRAQRRSGVGGADRPGARATA